MKKEMREIPPSVEKLANSSNHELSHAVRVGVAREVVEKLREGGGGTAEDLFQKACSRLLSGEMKKVVNATGVVLHTNLGRAPLGKEMLEEMAIELSGYCNLEFDLEKGERGSRGEKCEEWITRLVAGGQPPGTIGSAVVNNNAAAVLLCLQELARGKKVIVSRGELVQIGGGFRIPEILQASGCELLEIGTTNITKEKDYRKALEENNDAIGAVLKIHRSNFEIVGHTEEVSVETISELAKSFKKPVVFDLGSGALTKVANEPTVDKCVRNGVPLTTFSGDKLFGGPQAGFVVGDISLIKRLRVSPLYRALRLGKMEYFVLGRILRNYLQGKVPPTLKMINESLPELRSRAEGLARRLEMLGLKTRTFEGESVIGGGTTPNETVESVLIEIVGEDADKLGRKLLKARTPVVCRREKGKMFVDPRTILPDDEPLLLESFKECLEK